MKLSYILSDKQARKAKYFNDLGDTQLASYDGNVYANVTMNRGKPFFVLLCSEKRWDSQYMHNRVHTKQHVHSIYSRKGSRK